MASGYSKCIPMAETKVYLICLKCDSFTERCCDGEIRFGSFYEVSL